LRRWAVVPPLLAPPRGAQRARRDIVIHSENNETGPGYRCEAVSGADGGGETALWHRRHSRWRF